MYQIVIVGGGVGGLELAIRLGRSVGKKGKAAITLIDRGLTHLWKPLLHEVAAGTLDSNFEEIDYLTLGRRNGFRFRPGNMTGLDRVNKTVQLAAIIDAKGEQVIADCGVPYDTLVLALGSEGNDYGIPGVKEHCIFLDSRKQADHFHSMLLNLFLRLMYQAERDSAAFPTLRVAIVGAGATGVELSAELYNVADTIKGFGFDHLAQAIPIDITLIEAAPRILPPLPEKLAAAAERQLKEIGVRIVTSGRVQSVTDEAILLSSGQQIPAHLKVWAAGIKAPEFFKHLDGLEVNRINQIMVQQNLMTTKDDNIFALGDCAHCPQPGTEAPVPPRSQSAHQQAAVLSKTLLRRLNGGAPIDFVYRDYGSLVSLSQSSVGNLMGNLTGNHFIEGWLARMIYLSLYRSHLWVLHGTLRTLALMLVDILRHRIKPRLKLH
jgi:NADH dehydrogenase